MVSVCGLDAIDPVEVSGHSGCGGAEEDVEGESELGDREETWI
jgi:hypothetical protein